MSSGRQGVRAADTRPTTVSGKAVWLPTGGVPAAPAAGGARTAGHEAGRPYHQDDDRHPPQGLEGEPGAEQDQGQQENKKKGNHFRTSRSHLPGADPFAGIFSQRAGRRNVKAFTTGGSYERQ